MIPVMETKVADPVAPPAPLRRHPYRPVLFILRLGVGLVILAILIWRANWSEALAAVARIDPGWLALAFAVQIIGKFIWALRWSVVLRIFQLRAPCSLLVKGIFVGLFFSNFLPTGIGGDLYRGYWIVKDRSLYPRSMFTIFVERYIGFATLGFVALPALIILVGLGWQFNWLLFLALVGLCASILLLHPAAFAFLDRQLNRLSSSFLAGTRSKVGQALAALHQARRETWKIYALSIAVHLVGVAFFYSLGRGLGLDLTMWQYLIIIPLTVAATLIPITINGLGVREGSLIVLTAALGANVEPSQAIALGVLSSVVVLLVSLIGGGFYLADGAKKSYVR